MPPGKSPSRWFVTFHSPVAISAASIKVRVKVYSLAAVRMNASISSVPLYVWPSSVTTASSAN